jgi:hypothetical protein
LAGADTLGLNPEGHCPLAGGVRGDAAEVHPAGAVLDEHQDVQEVDR